MNLKSAIKYFLYFSVLFACIVLVLSAFVWLRRDQFSKRVIWSQEYLDLCNNATVDTKWTKNDSVCLTFVHKLRPVNIEILNWAPALVIYRDLLTERQVAGFLKTFKERDLESQKVQSNSGRSVDSRSRIANGSSFPFSHNNITMSVFNSAQESIPSFNLSISEQFSGLSYFPGGFYAPHYDLIDDPRCSWVKTFRDRVATLIFVFQTSKEGGGTVFPRLRTTVRANAGDAFFWVNMKSDETKEDLSLHGGCPVYEGEKVISTTWIHAKHQPIISLANTDHPISAEWLIPGLTQKIKPEIQNQCY